MQARFFLVARASGPVLVSFAPRPTAEARPQARTAVAASREAGGGKQQVVRKVQQALLNAALLLLCITLWAEQARADHATAVTLIRSGNSNYYAGDYISAEGLYLAAITNDPTWAVSYNNRGLARFHRGNFTGANADFDTAKTNDSSYLSPYVNKGKSLAAQRRFAEAVSEFQAGLSLTTTNPNAALYFNLGWVCDEQGWYTQAITNYTMALTISTNHHGARLGRGISYAKLASISNAITDFYRVINDAPAGDMVAARAAYNLQLMRGPGLCFNTDAGATNFLKGEFGYSTEQYDAAIASLLMAQTNEPALADIPWVTAWSYLGKHDTNSANAALAQAYGLMPVLTLRCIGSQADIFVDGLKRGTAPARLHLFSNGFDLSLRRVSNDTRQEWRGVTYTDGTPGGSNVMALNPLTVTNFPSFGSVADADRDWLADDWELHWYGSLAQDPEGDETDHDGASNLQEFWASTNPTNADSDADGISDIEEILGLNTDPLVWNRFYYVNDASTNNDAWCTAPGDDSNDGRQNPAAPKASVQAILDAHDLEPGDVVLIDTGTYNLTYNITVGTNDGGASNAVILFAASPYGVTFDRGGETASGRYCWAIEGPHVVVKTASSGKYPALPQTWMKVTGGNRGIAALGNYSQVNRIEACSNYVFGFSLGGAYVQIEQCIARNNNYSNRDGAGGVLVGNREVTVNNCTIAGNRRYGIYVLGDNGTTLANNVVCADRAGDYAVYRANSTGQAFASDYNLFFTTNGATLGYSQGDCTTLAEWRRNTRQDAHSLVKDPLFVDVSTGNFHLRSQGGYYDAITGRWGLDIVTSPGVDRGDPLCMSDIEGPPNGDRINIGAYGNTHLASKSPNQDLDGDGLPDWWEVYYFGTITGVTPQADPDGDGMTNASEFTAGTDPRDRNSRLEVTSLRAGPHGFLMRFPTVLGRVYAVEYSATLASWSALTSGLPGTGGTVTFNDPSAVGNSYRFYRVRVHLAP